MKTSFNMQQHDSRNKASKHVFMAMMGVIIAIICSLVIVQEMKPVNDETSATEIMDAKEKIGFQVNTSLSIGSIFK